MLSNVTFYSGDEIWCGILTDLGATRVEPKFADVNFDLIRPKNEISPSELKFLIMQAIDETQRNAISQVFGAPQQLPGLLTQIIFRLHQSGGMTSEELKSVLGYSADTATHAIDTAIYNLRKSFGRDFIKNENGIYKINNKS